MFDWVLNGPVIVFEKVIQKLLIDACALVHWSFQLMAVIFYNFYWEGSVKRFFITVVSNVYSL